MECEGNTGTLPFCHEIIGFVNERIVVLQEWNVVSSAYDSDAYILE
jgi:hypothetical protein